MQNRKKTLCKHYDVISKRCSLLNKQCKLSSCAFYRDKSTSGEKTNNINPDNMIRTENRAVVDKGVAASGRVKIDLPFYKPVDVRGTAAFSIGNRMYISIDLGTHMDAYRIIQVQTKKEGNKGFKFDGTVYRIVEKIRENGLPKGERHLIRLTEKQVREYINRNNSFITGQSISKMGQNNMAKAKIKQVPAANLKMHETYGTHFSIPYYDPQSIKDCSLLMDEDNNKYISFSYYGKTVNYSIKKDSSKSKYKIDLDDGIYYVDKAVVLDLNKIHSINEDEATNIYKFIIDNNKENRRTSVNSVTWTSSRKVIEHKPTIIERRDDATSQLSLKQIINRTQEGKIEWLSEYKNTKILYYSSLDHVLEIENTEKGCNVLFNQETYSFEGMRINKSSLTIPSKYQNRYIIQLLLLVLKLDQGQQKRIGLGNAINEPSKSNSIIEDNKDTSIINKAKVDITAADIIVYSMHLNCRYKNHNLVNEYINLPVYTFDDKNVIITLQAAYCKNCKVFYVYKDDYEKIKRVGVPKCKIISKEIFYKYGNNVFSLKTGNLDYVLSEYGYNVRQIDNLSQHTRHVILKQLIDNHILTASEIKQKIRLFQSSKRSLKNYQQAINKWENDYDFVDRLEKETRYAKINAIHVNNYRKN